MKWSYDAALLLVDYLYYSQNHTINQCNRAAENLAYCLTANSGVTEDDGTAIGYRFVLAYIQSFNVTKEDLRSIWGKIDGLTKEVYLLSETKYEVFQQQVALAKEAFAFSEYGSQVEQQLSPTEPIETDTPAEDISYSKQLGIPADAFTEMELEELDLSARGFHLLKRAGAKTVSDVLLFTPSQLMQMKGLGNGTFNEIEKKLSSLQNDMTVSKQKVSFADISICKAHAAEICTGDFTWVEQEECSDLQLAVIEDYKEAYDILGADLSFKASYSAKGGITLEQWTALQNQLKAEEEKRERLNWQRKALATDVLPFWLLRNTLACIEPQIQSEKDYIAYRALKTKLDDSQFTTAIQSVLSDNGITSESGDVSVQLANRLSLDHLLLVFCLITIKQKMLMNYTANYL